MSIKGKWTLFKNVMVPGFGRAEDLEEDMPKAVVVSMLGIGLAVVVVMVIIWSISRFFKKRIKPDFYNQVLTNGKDESWDERRRQARMDVSWPATMETPDGTVQVTLKNISYTGAFVVCPAPMALNERFRMIIEAPKQDPFPLQAEVIWTNVNVPRDKVVYRGMGVRFIENNEEDRTHLNNALEADLLVGEKEDIIQGPHEASDTTLEIDRK